MDLVVFEYDQNYVLECFRRGEFDFVDGVSEVGETEFFRYIGAKKILGKLAETYPSPREKEEVPLWMYVASNLSMRLHGVRMGAGAPEPEPLEGLPPVLRIFESFGVTKDRLCLGRGQCNLLSFGAEQKAQKQKSLFDY